ncbi:MAG: 1-acyl-sn-glycerol-3-phosphate acyltransferase [Nitriliruptorales bacterium]|nr:1-acyl-sn-glycerol-3-phosphate acyltransferase [Nitriliruptorales bacterium]
MIVGVPPRWFRRLVLAPLILTASLVLALGLPFLVLAAWLYSVATRSRDRAARILVFLAVYMSVESVALVRAFWLWVAAGFGRRRDEQFLERHYELLRWALASVVDAARGVLDVRFDVDDRDPSFDDDLTTRETRPVIVLSRHAGPGDSFLLVEELLVSGHRPRIVLKSLLQWEPLLDIVLNRVPSSFVGGGRDQTLAEMTRLAGGMSAGDAFVLFPEGANFTESRRQRSIAKLEEAGEHERAERARRMRHVLSPRSAGTLAVLEAAPEADVIFVAHTGLEDLSRPIDLWRGLPLHAEIEVASWRVSAEEIPETEHARRDWLDDWWHRIDEWIVDTRGTESVPDAVSEQLERWHR